MPQSVLQTHNEESLDSELKTVLLVDDDEKLLRGLQRHLDSEFEVLTAVSPAEANAMIARNNVEVVLSDNLMAGVLGTDFLRNINAQYPEIKLLMLSGYLPDALAKRMMAECGVAEVLTKPCEATVVANAIRNALKQS